MRGAGLIFLMLLFGCQSKTKDTEADLVKDDQAPPIDSFSDKEGMRYAGRDGPTPIPEGARVTLELDKEQYFLGENVLLHFRLENVGTKPFSYSTGGDYRFASRQLRFRVIAIDAKGYRTADPDPTGFCRGGLMGGGTLGPGEKEYFPLPLVRYCRFERPGLYTIRATHDFGWKGTPERKHPVGEVRIKLVMPTEEEARAVVEEMEHLRGPLSPLTKGTKGSLGPDFTALAYPIYLPILLERAKAGSDKALDGIGAIPSPEATRALIGLLDSQEPAFSEKALRVLNFRLPDPQIEGKTGPRYFLENTMAAQRRRLVQASWRPEFAPLVLAHGRKLLAKEDKDSLFCGAFILECLGGKEEFPVLVKALDRAVEQTQRTPRETWHYPPPRGACAELRCAAQLLVERGAEVPTDPKSTGEAVIFLSAFGLKKDFRPPGWEATCARLLHHEIPYVRQLVLELTPKPPSKAFIDALPALLGDADVDVRIAACRVAEQANGPELRAPILKVIASATDKVLLSMAIRRAEGAGCRYEVLEILASRLDEPDAAVMCLNELMPRVIALSGVIGRSTVKLDAATGALLKQRWSKLVQDHRDALGAGKRVELDSPDVTRDLFPKGFQFNLKDGKTWPSRNDGKDKP